MTDYLRRPVPGGWIYEVPWQYDLGGYSPSLQGVNHVFVPLAGMAPGSTKPSPPPVLPVEPPPAPLPAPPLPDLGIPKEALEGPASTLAQEQAAREEASDLRLL